MLALGAVTSSPAMAQSAPIEGCLSDHECQDLNLFTMNWCDNFECHAVSRWGNQCTASEWSWCLWDGQCDDGDSETVDWCDLGTCKNHLRSARPGNCDAPKGCLSGSDEQCDDGDDGSINWCHEKTCREVPREDPTCVELNAACTTDEECAELLQEGGSSLVSWCHEQKCHVNRVDAVDECVPINTLPDY